MNSTEPKPQDLNFVIERVRRTFHRGVDSMFLRDIEAAHRRWRLAGAIRRHDSELIFKWLVASLSYQGISDRVAEQFMAEHGHVEWSDVGRVVRRPLACHKLQSYWHFEGCGYEKGSGQCACPKLIAGCGLPQLALRNGRLNQTAASLFLFVRDVMAGDIVGWIDRQLANSIDEPPSARASALVEPLRHIFGVSDKTLSMVLSTLMLGARSRPIWRETGASFVVIDTLVHNHFHRTGVAAAMGFEHPFGPMCYRQNGCADAIRLAAVDIDASAFDAKIPSHFPRFVQYGIWRFCAQDGFDVCNGNRIDDRQPCQHLYCPDFAICEKRGLKL
jgi:hypothetical protein